MDTGRKLESCALVVQTSPRTVTCVTLETGSLAVLNIEMQTHNALQFTFPTLSQVLFDVRGQVWLSLFPPRGQVTCLKSQSWEVVDMCFDSVSSRASWCGHTGVSCL